MADQLLWRVVWEGRRFEPEGYDPETNTYRLQEPEPFEQYIRASVGGIEKLKRYMAKAPNVHGYVIGLVTDQAVLTVQEFIDQRREGQPT